MSDRSRYRYILERKNMSEYIPFEIQTEIIQRLPAKSAVKFRLVSKLWNSYIGSSEFIIPHHRRNIHHQPPRLLTWYKNPADVDRFVTLLDDDDTFYQQDFTPKSQGLTKLLKDLKVIGCSHGLVCLYGSYYHHPSTRVVIVWNPLIKKSVQVVLPPSASASDDTRNLAGFGVCPVTFDPTVVSISLPWKAEVFTLSSGTWRSLVSSNLSRKKIILPSAWVRYQVVIDKFIYFNAREERIDATGAQLQDVNLIVSFDMTTHEFEMIDLPDNLSHSLFLRLFKIRESLVFVVEPMNMDVVWMMEDIVTKSFTKLYAIEVPNPFTKIILGFRKSGEPIMDAHCEGEETRILEVYEPCSKHIRKLRINGERFSFFASSYVETLLLLDQADCHIHADSD